MAAPTAPTTNKPASSSSVVRRRRFLPWWLLALLGGGIAAGFGVSVEHLRWGPPLVMLCLGGAALGWASSTLWSVLSPLFDELPEADQVTSEAPHHRRELEREKQLVLKAIKEVELDFQMRKIAPEDYKDMSERYRARALRLIAELDAGDDVRGLIERELKLRLAAARAAAGAEAAEASKAQGTTKAGKKAVPLSANPAGDATAATSPARTCTSCGTVNDADAVFCKKCGTKCNPGSTTS